MSDEEIRLMLTNPVLRIRIKRLMITAGDDDILNCVKSGDNTSNRVSDRLCISVSSASQRMEKLTLKGYLTREMVQQPSGGYEWQYKTCFG